MLKKRSGFSIVTRESVGGAILAFATLWGGPAAAQVWPEPAVTDTVVPLEEVVVSTLRATTTTGGSSAVVVAPDSLHLAPAPTLEQVLRELPFVSVRENSRGQAEITIRGSKWRSGSRRERRLAVAAAAGSVWGRTSTAVSPAPGFSRGPSRAATAPGISWRGRGCAAARGWRPRVPRATR